MSEIVKLRENFQRQVCLQSIFLKKKNIPSIADANSKLSSSLATDILQRLNYPINTQPIHGQTAGYNFEQAIKRFLQSAITLLSHLRPAEWNYSLQGDISQFVQYQHLAELNTIIQQSREARTALGNYVVKPDVVIARMPVTDDEINKNIPLVNEKDIPTLTPFRQANQQTPPAPILHASISCKLTLRSDRSQNARTEGLNLIRNRKGHTPHIAIVTAEPMPTRIASLALGTGDIDCVYHFSLNELVEAAKSIDNEAVLEALEIMIEGNRLRDIADLPFDLLA